jgi:hypothetical protein
MHTGGVYLDHFTMANRTVDFLRNRTAGTLEMRAGSGMALRAGNIIMFGIMEFLRIDGQGYLLSVPYHLDVRLGVAGQTFFIGDFIVKYFADFVWFVAIDANRNLVRLFFPKLTADRFFVDFFDSLMALLARTGNIIPVN